MTHYRIHIVNLLFHRETYAFITVNTQIPPISNYGLFITTNSKFCGSGATDRARRLKQSFIITYIITNIHKDTNGMPIPNNIFLVKGLLSKYSYGLKDNRSFISRRKDKERMVY